MTPSKAIKSIKLKSLQFVADKSDTHRTVLEGWYYTKPDRFWAIAYGVKYQLERVDDGR
jgi:hypothetical protein